MRAPTRRCHGDIRTFSQTHEQSPDTATSHCRTLLLRYVQMFDTLHSVRSALETTASNLVIARLDGPDALRLAGELGAIRRLTDGLIANAAARCDATYAHRPSGAKDAATAVGRAVGVTRAEAQRSIDLVAALRKRPLTDTAVRRGTLSIRQAEMIVAVATTNPAAEGELIDTAIQGMAALQNACLNARNAACRTSVRKVTGGCDSEMWPYPEIVRESG